jgi:hypothetical protein
MKSNLSTFLKAAKERGHNLNSLIALSEKFKFLNPEFEINLMPEIGFNDLESLPGVEYTDLFLESVKMVADIRNGKILPGRIPPKEL